MACSDTTASIEGKKLIPVTLLSGFLGSGKTTLLKNVLENKENLRVALIVNDMAELNIDAALIQQSKLVQVKEEVVQLSNGCICCTLRGDLLKSIKALADEGTYDHILIESSGIAEPMQVAETFALDMDTASLPEGPGFTLSSVARLDTCVTVIDTSEFDSLADSVASIAEATGEGKDESEGEKSISNLLLDQIEFANVIVLNKTDLVSAETLQRVTTVVRKLNPKAKIIPAVFSAVDIKNILNTGLFCMEEAETAAGWLHDLKGLTVHTPETVEYGISSFVYKAREPFHPAKLFGWLQRYFVTDNDKLLSANKDALQALGVERKKTLVSELGWIIRSKGFSWLADTHDHMSMWNHGGRIVSLETTQRWFCTIPDSEWGMTEDVGFNSIYGDFEPKFGDRRQAIVFIGSFLNRERIESTLNECLMSESDFLEYHKALLPSHTTSVATTTTSTSKDKKNKKKSKISHNTIRPFHAIIPLNGEFRFTLAADTALELTSAKFVNGSGSTTLPPVGVFLSNLNEYPEEEEEGDDESEEEDEEQECKGDDDCSHDHSDDHSAAAESEEEDIGTPVTLLRAGTIDSALLRFRVVGDLPMNEYALTTEACMYKTQCGVVSDRDAEDTSVHIYGHYIDEQVTAQQLKEVVVEVNKSFDVAVTSTLIDNAAKKFSAELLTSLTTVDHSPAASSLEENDDNESKAEEVDTAQTQVIVKLLQSTVSQSSLRTSTPYERTLHSLMVYLAATFSSDFLEHNELQESHVAVLYALCIAERNDDNSKLTVIHAFEWFCVVHCSVLLPHFAAVLELLLDTQLLDRTTLLRWFLNPLRDYSVTQLTLLMITIQAARQLKRLAQPFLTFVEFEFEEPEEEEEKSTEGKEESSKSVVVVMEL